MRTPYIRRADTAHITYTILITILATPTRRIHVSLETRHAVYSAHPMVETILTRDTADKRHE